MDEQESLKEELANRIAYETYLLKVISVANVYAMNYEEWMDSFIPHFIVLHNADGEECS